MIPAKAVPLELLAATISRPTPVDTMAVATTMKKA
jgi:hypothetical protein